MRIISGSHKGRKIPTFDIAELRPTKDSVREAIFSSLFSRFALEGASVLDLYAGSGALGLEALSRGAECCVFVETQRSLAQQLNNTLESFGLANSGTVVQTRVEKFLGSESDRQFSLIFADPPYAGFQAIDFLRRLLSSNVLPPKEALLVLECASQTALPQEGSSEAQSRRFILENVKQYGATQIAYYSAKPIDN